ncbi:hypothetical protein PENTCL1PPCAC_6745, partial [Pristionchus entomophagus]
AVYNARMLITIVTPWFQTSRWAESQLLSRDHTIPRTKTTMTYSPDGVQPRFRFNTLYILFLFLVVISSCSCFTAEVVHVSFRS